MAFVWYVGGEPQDYARDHARIRNRQVDPVDSISPLKPKKKTVEREAGDDTESHSRQGIDAYRESNRTEKERQPAILVEQIMSSPVQSLSPETTLYSAWQIFREKRFRHIPVLDAEKNIKGMISDRDILKILAGVSSSQETDISVNDLKSNKVADHMKQEVLSARPDTTIREVARTMFEEQIGAMPVVSEEGELKGIVTRSDILRAVMTRAPLELWI